jgi:fructose-1,6-bisphosphatase/sedoheptulose 1,7-bisphosphatase-like protein
VDLDGDVAWNLEQAAHALDREVSDVRVVALDRDRHADLIRDVRGAGAQLDLMSDGDVSAAIWAARDDGPFDLLLGIGAAPEGVITATALRGLGGVFQGRLVLRNDEEAARAATMVGDDLDRRWEAEDLCTSKDAVFIAAGVCDGYLPGVVLDEGRSITSSEVIDVASGTRRSIVTERRR